MPQAPLDPAVVRRIPYHAARTHGVVAARQVGDAIELWVREGADVAALSEARRVLAMPLLPVLLAGAEFDARLALAYAREDATRNGWLSLYDDGLRWVATGETSLEEAMRVAQA